MKLAVYTCSTPEYDIEQAAALIGEIGYDAVEWRVHSTGPLAENDPRRNLPEPEKYAQRYWIDNRATLNIHNIMHDCLRAKKACDEAGLEIVNLAASPKGGAENLEPLLEAASAIGCKTVRGPMVKYDPARPYWEQFGQLREYLRQAEPMLRKHGVKLLIETHHGMLISSASSAMRLLEGFDSEYFGVIYDPGNMVYEGYENYRLGFEMLGKYLAHVHVKNACLVPSGEDEFGAVVYRKAWMPLHKGSANLFELIRALKQVGYDGVISVEDFSDEKPTKEKLKENLACLKAWIASC